MTLRRRLCLLAGSCIIPLLVTTSSATDGPVIVRVDVVAPGLDDPRPFLTALGLAPGRPLDRHRLRTGVQVLYAGGQVERLRVESADTPAGLDLTVRIDLRPRIARIVVDAPGFRLRGRVRDWLGLHAGWVLDEVGLEARAKLVRRRLRDLGFSHARVEPYIDYTRATNSAVVTVAVDPGLVERLGQVILDGAPAAVEKEVAAAATRFGARLSSSQVERCRAAAEAELRRSGYWEAEVSAGERRSGPAAAADLVLKVSPGPLYRLEVVAPAGRDSLVLQAIPDPVEEDLHPAQSEALAQRVRISLEERGYLLAQVRAELDTSGSERTLRVVADPDGQRRVDAVLFEGATSVRRKALEAATRVHPGRAGGWRGQEVSEATLATDRLSLEELYRRQGFAEVRVDTPRIEPADEKGVRVVFPVHEGQRWVVADLRLEEFPVETASALDSVDLGLSEGGPWDPGQVDAARRRLEMIVTAAGYPEGRVETSVDTSEPGAARVLFRAVPGRFVRVGAVAIAGLARTRPGVVRRALTRAGVVTGAPLSSSSLLAAQRRLGELGLFRRIELGPIPGQERETERGLVVRCAEGAQRSYLLGLGWDTEDHTRLTLGWTHLNLFGGAHAVSVETRLSSREERVQASLREPLLPGLGLPGYAAVYRTEETFTSFSQLRRGLWLEVGDRRAHPLRAWLRYEYQIVRPDAPPEILSELERQEQQIQVASLTPALEWDTRDDPLEPRRGHLVSLSLEWAFPLFQADARFLKLQSSFSLYRHLPGGTGALGLRLGAIRPIASGGAPANLEVPIATRFFAGGRTTNRAFATDRLGIEGQTLSNGDPVGGNFLLLLNLEYQRRVRGSLMGVLFLDGGNVWAAPSRFGAADLRWGLGLGLRYDTPAGPLRLEYGRKLDRQPGESGGELFLSFGTPF